MHNKNISQHHSILKSILYTMILILVGACDKAPKSSQLQPDTADSLATGYFICNEGNFQWNNASMSFYNTAKKVLYEDVYKTINNKSLGDVLQSMVIYNNMIYAVLNNSGKIEMMHPKTFVSSGTIAGLRSPRYFLGINATKAYVSDLYDNQIAVLDLQQKKVVGKIPCKGWTEEMLLVGNRVFVCNKTSEYLYIVNGISDQISDSIAVGYGSSCILTDALNRIWILTSGNTTLSIPPQLHVINPQTLGIISSFNFPMLAKPLKLITNTNKTKLYWINNQVYTMNMDATQLPTSPWINTGNRNLYALGYHNMNAEILIGDAKDFVQRSEILRYDTTGNLLGSYSAGINTSSFINK